MLPLPNSIFAYFDVCQPDAVPGETSDQVSIVNQGMFMYRHHKLSPAAEAEFKIVQLSQR
jgi:hypothetical protein